MHTPYREEVQQRHEVQGQGEGLGVATSAKLPYPQMCKITDT
jgi:hypothetical protein